MASQLKPCTINLFMGGLHVRPCALTYPHLVDGKIYRLKVNFVEIVSTLNATVKFLSPADVRHQCRD